MVGFPNLVASPVYRDPVPSWSHARQVLDDRADPLVETV